MKEFFDNVVLFFETMFEIGCASKSSVDFTEDSLSNGMFTPTSSYHSFMQDHTGDD
jgi:hypothetical protein